MARYIDADLFCGWLETVLEDFGEPNISIRPIAFGTQNALRSVYDVIKKQPTADVVEVVRCKDCQYVHINSSSGKYHCKRRGYFSEEVKPTDFCSYGLKGEKL